MNLLERLQIRHPIILAPLAGGPSTPELAAAVTNAGGLGSLGIEYLTLEQIQQTIARTRSLTRGPININLFAPTPPPDTKRDPAPVLQLLSEVHRELNLGPPELPSDNRDDFESKFQAVIATQPEVFSFTFGMLPTEATQRLKSKAIFVIGTATTVEEGELLARGGVDAVVAQGSEAGGHRGTFAGAFEESMVSTLDLTRALHQRLSIPIIASGGIMDGNDINHALAAGAEAVQMGTAFLTCPEAGTSKPYRHALSNARSDTTIITRAYSGRPARGLRNHFATTLEQHPDWILPFPLQNSLTRPMRIAAAAQGNPEYLSLWAGTGVAKSRAVPAGELVAQLVSEMNHHPNRVSRL